MQRASTTPLKQLVQRFPRSSFLSLHILAIHIQESHESGKRLCVVSSAALSFFSQHICRSGANRSVKMCVSSVMECYAKCCKCQSICKDVTGSHSVSGAGFESSAEYMSLKARHASGMMLICCNQHNRHLQSPISFFLSPVLKRSWWFKRNSERKSEILKLYCNKKKGKKKRHQSIWVKWQWAKVRT